MAAASAEPAGCQQLRGATGEVCAEQGRLSGEDLQAESESRLLLCPGPLQTVFCPEMRGTAGKPMSGNSAPKP